jgi:hypothetical protein
MPCGCVKRHSAEEKIRIVLEGLRGENSIAELCRTRRLEDKQTTCWPLLVAFLLILVIWIVVKVWQSRRQDQVVCSVPFFFNF